MYWERKPYRGFGLGACSFDGISRLQNEKNLMRYMEGIEKGEWHPYFVELISEEQVFAEKLMLGLRRVEGVIKQEIISHLTDVKKNDFTAQLGLLKEKKLIVENGGRLKLTPAGLIVENEIITRLSL